MDKILENGACITLFDKERSTDQRRFFNSLIEDIYISQDLYATEFFLIEQLISFRCYFRRSSSFGYTC